MTISTPPAPPKTGWWANLVDSAWWLWHSTLSTITNAPATWKDASRHERAQLLSHGLTTVVIVLFILAFGLPWWCWALPLANLVDHVDDFAVLEEQQADRALIARQHQRLVEQLAEQPTGAPRVAEVTLPGTDVTYRFVYGPKGWEFAGPAVSHGPSTTREESMRD